MQKDLFGNLRKIVMDRGTVFLFKEFQGYCGEEGINHVLIAIRVPRRNG